MASFTIQNPYPTKAHEALNGDLDESDFEINSDVSDAELLELRQELKKLDPHKMERDLAEATKALQEMAMQRWERYCAHVRKDPSKLLKKCDTTAFQNYLI